MDTADVLAAGVALVLAAGALAKVIDRADFARAVAAYAVVPPRLVPPVSLLVPALETAAATCLLVPAARPTGVALALLVLGLVTAAVGLNLVRGHRVLDCGCGGPSGRQPLSWWLVVRNTGLAGCVVLGLAPGLQIDLVGAAGGALAFMLLHATLDRLIANRLAFRDSGWTG